MNIDLRKHRWIVVVTASVVGLMVFACSLTSQKDKQTQGEPPVATQTRGEPPVATQTEAAQVQSSPLKLISQLGGGVWAVDVQGQVAYVGVGPRLWVLDTSSNELKVLGQSEVLTGKVRGVEVRDNYAYVATFYTGDDLVIFDISNPAQPRRISQLNPPDCAGALNLRLEGDLVYLACYGGLRIVDISNPQAPVTLGSLELAGKATFYSVDVQDGYAYLADRRQGLIVVDISDPANPIQVALQTPDAEFTEKYGSGGYYDVRADGDFAYVASNGGLLVLDISDPAHPTQAGLFVTHYKQSNNSLEIVGNQIYLVNEFDGVYILDISNPASPQQLGLISQPLGRDDDLSLMFNGTRDLAIVDGKLYLPDASFGLIVWDIQNPTSPVWKAHYHLPVPEQMGGLVVAGERAYLYGSECGLRVVDISDPAEPQEVGFDDGRLKTWGQIMMDGRVQGNTVYITDLNAGFWVFTISETGAPSRAGYLSPGNAEALEVIGNYAYLFWYGTGAAPGSLPAGGESGGAGAVQPQGPGTDYQTNLLVLDISNPANLQTVGTIKVPSGSHAMAEQDGYLYLATNAPSYKLNIYDLSDPIRPQLVSETSFTGMGGYSSIAISGNYTYLGGAGKGVVVLDTSDLAQPELVFEYENNSTRGLALDEEFLYVAPFLYILDRTDPEKLSFLTFGNSLIDFVAVQDGLIYALGSDSGLWIYRFEDTR